MNKAMLAGMIVLGLAVPALVGAQEPARPHKTPEMADSNSSTADVAWMMKVAKGGMAEVELGRLATEKAASDEVKKFCQRKVDDHSKANDELKILAQNKKITLPADMDPKEKALRDRLTKLSGPAFDRAYMQAMLADHRQDVAEFRKEASSGKDGDVKAFAAKTLPTLEDHLKMAEQTNKTASSAMTKTSRKQ